MAKDLVAHFEKSGVSTIVWYDIAKKIKQIIDKYASFKKSIHRDTKTQRLNEEKFVDLFVKRLDIFRKSVTTITKKIKRESESLKTEQFHQASDVNDKIAEVNIETESESLKTEEFHQTSDVDYKIAEATIEAELVEESKFEIDPKDEQETNGRWEQVIIFKTESFYK